MGPQRTDIGNSVANLHSAEHFLPLAVSKILLKNCKLLTVFVTKTSIGNSEVTILVKGEYKSHWWCWETQGKGLLWVSTLGRSKTPWRVISNPIRNPSTPRELWASSPDQAQRRKAPAALTGYFTLQLEIKPPK